MPNWLLDKNVIDRIGPVYSPLTLQSIIVSRLFFTSITSSLALFEELDPKNAYRYVDFMDDFYNFVWKKTKAGANLNMYDCNLQIAYVDKLLDATGLGANKAGSPFGLKNLNEVEKQLLTDNIDWQKAGFEFNTMGTTEMVKNAAVYQKLQEAYSLLKSRMATGNAYTRAHYQNLVFKIKRALEK